MSLLLDALDRAERARREQRSLSHPELSLEARPGDAPEPEAAVSPRAQAASLFQLDDESPRPWKRSVRRYAPLAGVVLVVAAGAAWWLWSALQLPSTEVNIHPALPPSAGPVVPVTPAAAPVAPVAATADPAPATAPVTAMAVPGPATAAPVAATAAPAAATGSAPAPAGMAPPVPVAPATAPIVRTATGPTRGVQAAPADLPASTPAPAAGAASRPPASARARGNAATPVRGVASIAGPAGVAAAAAGSTSPSAAAASGAQEIVSAPSVDVRLFRSAAPAQPDAALVAAWTALRDGHLDEAGQAYQRLEQQQPRNPDVQLGLARLAAEQGQPEQARVRYRRVLELDPQNPTALAGLAVLEPAGASSELDSQLRSRAAGSSGAAQYALAARDSAGGQWPEAEQAWFEALRDHPGDPDVLYNLAVALDHLGQASAARQYYGEALQAAQGRPAHFSRPQVDQRLQALGAP